MDNLSSHNGARAREPIQAAERSVEAPWNTIGHIVGLFSPQECENYFATCGYDVD